MLRSFVILFLLAGVAIADPKFGWKDGKEYTYKIRSRTLASFNQNSEQFTGLLIEGYLTVQRNGQNTLRAKIETPRYSQIHTHLHNGWESEIPQNQVNLQNFPLSGEPFEIKIKNGVVNDLIVDKDVPTWEVNILKSIVSQLQVDTQGENAEYSKHNQLPEGNEPYALFKTMEDSVTGQCEVLYDISPLPEHFVQNKFELVPMPELRENGDIISVVKTKNFSNCEQRVSYHFGMNEENREYWEAGDNDNGEYLSRASVSRVVISGNLKEFTIQSSVTTNKVMHRAHRESMVASKMNLTLYKVKDIDEQVSSPSNPQSTGNLVYNYNNPFESSSSRRPNRFNKDQKNWQSRDKNQHNNRHSHESNSNESSGPDSSSGVYDNDDNSYLQPKPTLTDAPFNPLLPFFIGNGGNSIQKNNQVDVVRAAKSIAQQIGSEMQKPDSMPEEQTLEKFTILFRLVRTMNADQIAEVQRELYEQKRSQNQLKHNSQTQSSRRYSWVAFRDAVAQSGTGPALVNIKQWIQNKKIKDIEAAQIVDAVARSARTPTPEYVDAYFDMVKMQETKEQPALRDASILSFADLVRKAIVDKRNAHNQYPVHAFGKFFSENNRNVEEKYIPHIAEELKNAIENGDSEKIQVYITAMGKTGHPQMLSVFEPYLEGRKQVSSYQRLVMVLSLDKLAETKPKVARAVLYKLYSNNADYHEIRTAAVYLLMKTSPPASMLQRMAEYTNYDSNKHVNSAVKSTIESLAALDNDEYRDISNAARAARPLLISKIYGPEYSRATFAHWKKPRSGIFFEANYIGSDDSIVPKGVYLSSSPTFQGWKTSKAEFGGTVSSWKNLWSFVERKFRNNKSSSKDQEVQDKPYSPENISKLLGIHGDEPEQVEGFVFMNGRYGNHFLSVDNHTLEKIPEQLRRFAEDMKEGKGYEEAKLNNFEITTSFPTETGFPFHFTYKAPILISVNAQAKFRTDNDDSDEQFKMPKSFTGSGKVNIVYGMEIQERLGFVAPFEHQEYMAGIDRSIQVHVPVRTEIEYDSKKQESRVKIQPNEDVNEYKVLQFKTQPFTSKHDIMNLEPVSKDKNTHIVHKDRAVSSKFELNDRNNKQRLQFNWERQPKRLGEAADNRDDKKQNTMDALSKLAQSISSLYYPKAADTEYQKYSIKVSPSNDMSAEMKISVDSMTTESDNGSDRSENWSPNAKAPYLEKGLSEHERKQKLLREASKNINSAQVDAVDISVQLNGVAESTMALTAAFGSSNVDTKSRALLFAWATPKQGQDYHFAAGLESKIPNAQSLYYEDTLKTNNRQDYDAEIHYGKGSERNSGNDQGRIKIQGKVKQTDELKNQIRHSHDAQSCSKQVNQSGNKITSICQTLNERAASIDAGEFSIKFENDSVLKDMAVYAIEKATEKHENKNINLENKQNENEIRVAFQVASDEESVDVTVKTPKEEIQLNNVDLDMKDDKFDDSDESNEKHSFEERARETNICSLDKTQAETFDNHRYSLQLGKCWHVAMTSFPKNNPDRPSVQQEIPEDMRMSILTRENDNGMKDLKVTLGAKEIEITESNRRTSAKVNGKHVEYSRQQSHQEKKNGEVLFEIFELPDKSLKLVSDKYDVEIVYDGSRAQIEAGDSYRDSVRGLCGNFDSENGNDQQSPSGCLLEKSEQFSASYALTKDNKCEGPARENAARAKKAQCTFESARPGNVISDREAGRDSRSESSDGNSEQTRCMLHRTKIIRNESEICFSLRPVPTCASECHVNSTKNRNIPFHCVPRTSTSEKVAQRIQNGANPDLSQKMVSRTENQLLPTSCSA